MSSSRDVLLPIVFFVLIYGCIVHYHDVSVDVYRSNVANIVTAVACALILSYRMIGKNPRISERHIGFGWLLFFALASISTSYSCNASMALTQLRLYFSVFLLGLAFSFWFSAPSAQMVVGFFFAMCFAHVLILLLVVAHAAGLADTAVGNPRVPYHGNIRHVAHHGIAAACGGVALLFIGGRARLAGYLLGAVAIFGLVFLGQRGGLLGLMVFACVTAYFLPRLRMSLAIACLLPVVFSVAVVYALDSHGIRNRYSGSIVERVQVRGKEVFVGTSGRLAVWKSSIELAKQRPLLGHGPDGFRTSGTAQSFSGIVQSHNVLMQALVEFGVIGLVLVSAYLGRTLRRLTRQLTQAPTSEEASRALFVSALFIAYLTVSLIEGIFYHPVSLIMAATIAPLAFAAIPKKPVDMPATTTSPRDTRHRH